ncbi:hypothetical protein GCM10027181_38340 [Rheinheimera gaetbuli]
MVEHRNLVNYQQHILHCYQMQVGDRMLQFSTPNFDIFVEEFIAALCNGACLVLRSDACLGGAQAFKRFGHEQGASVISLPTAFFHELENNEPSWAWPSLRLVIVGGEALSSRLAQNFVVQSPKVRLLNTYGPTETTITATSFTVLLSDERCVPIGKPNSNTCVYVLDSQRQLVPQGVVGELYIGGDGLARGYLNRDALTEEKFIANPFGEGRLYKTGDLVRWLPDGTLEFLGRIDHQIKLRGFRIELGEIENSLSNHAWVQDVVVLAKATSSGDSQLVAYICPVAEHYSAEWSLQQKEEQTTALKQALTKHLKQSLPEYMVPGVFVLLERLPLTPNGKVDRKVLPEPDISSLQAEYTAPATETEQALAEIWQKLLGLERVGVHDNFFTLGGHSLLALRMLVRVREVKGRPFTLSQVFEYPVLKNMAKVLDGAQAVRKIAEVCTQLNPGTSDSQPLFLIHPVEGDIYGYHELVQNLPSELPVYGLSRPELVNPAASVNIWQVEALAALYIKEIKAVQKNGPYRLLGWSLGGVLALEISQQLRNQNQQVAYLGIIDSVWHTQKSSSSSKSAMETLLRDEAQTLVEYLDTLAEHPLLLSQFDKEQQIAELSVATGQSEQRMREIVLSGIVGQERYTKNPVHRIGRVQYFSAKQSKSEQKPSCINTLKELSLYPFACHELEADHHSIMKSRAVKEMSRLLMARLLSNDELRQ